MPIKKFEIKGDIIPNDWKEVYDYYSYESTCPNDVKKILEQADGRVTVDILTSYGGNIFAGSDIYTLLRSYGQVYIRVFSIAASATSIIAMAGESEISPTAMLMAHLVSGGAEGNYHKMDQESDVLKQASRALANAYMAKSGMSETEAMDLMEKESWLTAQQAVEFKLIDRVMFSQDPRLLVASPRMQLAPAVIDKTLEMLRNQKAPEVSNQEKEKLQLLIDCI